MSVAVAATTEVVDLGGMLIRQDCSLAAAPESDLLVIPVRREPLAAVDHRIVAAVRCGAVRAAGSGSSVAGLWTGAFVLGAAGLLDGLPCTTHWRWCDRLAEPPPRARVFPMSSMPEPAPSGPRPAFPPIATYSSNWSFAGTARRRPQGSPGPS